MIMSKNDKCGKCGHPRWIHNKKGNGAIAACSFHDCDCFHFISEADYKKMVEEIEAAIISYGEY